MNIKKILFLLVAVLDLVLACSCLFLLNISDPGFRIPRELPVSDGGGAGSSEGGMGELSPAGRDGDKFLALTFDDGPHPVYTKKLLDGLKERGIHASFFLVGKSIEGNEELVRRMSEEGHLVGTHCYSHEDLTKKSAEKACMDIIKTNDAIERITGRRPVYIRPPYGIWSEELEECVGMTPVFWDIDTLDWKSQNTQAVLRHISKNAGKHQVILLHDVFDTSVDAALSAIDTLTRQGYTFVTVDELLID